MRPFGPFVVEGELGRGGAGLVYRARGPSGEPVALKVLVARGPDDVQVRRLAREVRVLERLRHPAIVVVHATGEAPAGPWIAMDLIDGGTLDARLARQGPLPPREAAAMLAELARAVSHAHEHGVLHRDIKPANVLLDRAGRPYLTDFGLAKDLEGSLHGASLSVTGQFMGTPGYWPPEQARGDRGAIGPASDVYALGATLFAMLTARPPHEAETIFEALQAAERGPPAPSSVNPDVPPQLDAIVARATRAAPADRYASAADLAAALDAWLAEQRDRAGRRRAGARRHGALVAALGAALVVAGLAVAWSSVGADPPPAPVVSAAPPGSSEPAEPTNQPPATGADAGAPTSEAELARLAARLDELRAREDLADLLGALQALPASVLETERGRIWHAEALVLRTLSDQRFARLERALERLEGLESTEARIVRADALGGLGRFEEAADEIASALDEPDPALRARALDMARSVGVAAFPEGQRALFPHHVGGYAPTRAAQAVRFFERLAAAAPPSSEVHVDALVRLTRARRVLEPTDRAALEATLDALTAAAPDADVRVRLLRAEHALCWSDFDAAAAALALDRPPPPSLAPVAKALAVLLETQAPRSRGDFAGELAALDGLPPLTGAGVWVTSFRGHVDSLRRMAREAKGEPRELTAAEQAERARRMDELLALGRLDEADALLASVPTHSEVALRPHAARLSLLRAGEAVRAGDRAASVYHLERALASAPQDFAVCAEANLGLRRFADARALFVAALAERPGDATLLSGAVEACRRAYPEVTRSFFGPAGASSGAVAGLAQVLACATDDARRAEVLTLLARAWHARGDAEQTRGALDEAARLDPGPAARLARAEWLLDRGETRAATEDLAATRRAVTASPELLMPRAGRLGALASALETGDPARLQRLLDAMLAERVDEADRWTHDLIERLRARARGADAR